MKKEENLDIKRKQVNEQQLDINYCVLKNTFLL